MKAANVSLQYFSVFRKIDFSHISEMTENNQKVPHSGLQFQIGKI